MEQPAENVKIKGCSISTRAKEIMKFDTLAKVF
jgi:hypothetical protein